MIIKCSKWHTPHKSRWVWYIKKHTPSLKQTGSTYYMFAHIPFLEQEVWFCTIIVYMTIHGKVIYVKINNLYYEICQRKLYGMPAHRSTFVSSSTCLNSKQPSPLHSKYWKGKGECGLVNRSVDLPRMHQQYVLIFIKRGDVRFNSFHIFLFWIRAPFHQNWAWGGFFEQDCGKKTSGQPQV